jgi:predicted RNase H-like nuclease (RuvC/YqgF family)
MAENLIHHVRRLENLLNDQAKEITELRTRLDGIESDIDHLNESALDGRVSDLESAVAELQS